RAHNCHYGPCPNGQKSPCYSVLILQFFQKALPRPTAKASEGRGEGSEEVLTPRVAISFLGPALSENIPLEPPWKRKGEVLRWRLPYSCSQRPKKRELSPASKVPPPPQRLVAPVPWNLTPAYFQGDQ